MKTIILTPQTLKPLKQKQQFNYTRSRILMNNIRNVQLDSINRISDIVSNRKFRDNGHLFYLKFTDRQRSKTIPTKPKYQLHQSGDLNRKYVDLSANLARQELNPEESVLISPEIKDPHFYKLNLKNMQPPSQKLSKIKNQQPRDQQSNNKTLYFYKKQSLNPELQFFKLYQQLQKPKLDSQIDFKNELIGTQKTFYHKIKPISMPKRSISVNTKQKMHDQPQNIEKTKQLNQVRQTKQAIKLQPIKPLKGLGKARQLIENKRKGQYFQPWSYAIEQQQTYRL